MGTLRFSDLEAQDDFVGRHIGPSEIEISDMLAEIGRTSLEGLIDEAVPDIIRAREPLDLPGPRTEADAQAVLRGFAGDNRPLKSFIGMGYYGTITPPVIRRNVLENPGWYTAYTPYQPEISQGRLEALLNFQTMVADLTGLPMASASLLDEATAAAEAMTLCHRVGKSKSDAFFVSDACHPQTIDVLKTRAEPLGIDLVIGDHRNALPVEVFGALVQYPDTWGEVHDYGAFADAVHAQGGLVVAAADLLALTLIAPPGAWGADAAVGSTQRFGVPMMFGGPHAAYMATSDAYKRSLPGRLVGVSIDSHGRPAYRLALQTREQHIRREKATSNICTAQVLLAVMAGLYAAWHGPEGLRRIALRVRSLTEVLKAGLASAGFTVTTETSFDTLVVETPEQSAAICDRAVAAGYNLRRIDGAHIDGAHIDGAHIDGAQIDGDRIGVSLDETASRADVAALWQAFAPEHENWPNLEEDQVASPEGTRPLDYLGHPVFHLYRSETEMLRYLKRLEDKDIALDRSMIPLGSCTMKLNAAAEMEPVSWPAFTDIHPFAPADQTEGYVALIRALEEQLCRITGFHAVTVQPNAGSQGEYAGLLTIRAYHRSRGEAGRDICLIPSSAHGTNPASAVMAGMQVVVVGCDSDGNIDLDDLRAKAARHADALAALMVTYPSTHGVFEEAIVEICQVVHDHGGQVYMDGANLNALVGVALPGRFGPDVAHLNLHKTFCIPHGGGGPGVGPIGVGAHLAPFLPGHSVRPECGGDQAIGPVSAAPWGSAGILAISWAYIHMMGGPGLTRATQIAILNANYVATRLKAHFPVLFTGPGGLVAHECIVDLRPLKDVVSVDDIAKRLMDFGFHAPTMSFPVAGTLMIEPTESESKPELDRFCDAMIAIREEIATVEKGAWPTDDNPLVNAPHTAEELLAADWEHPYSREKAAFPMPALRSDKYWPPIARIDNAYGDRHLICACPPLEAYENAAE